MALMKAMIKVGYGCNEHCTFCHTLELRSIDAEAAEVSRKIRRAKELGHTMVVLSGGEPTIRSELMHWAAEVAALKMDFGLITNGRLLSYPEVVDRLQSLGLKYVYLSLHGGSARVHNRLVRADAFEQSCGALSVLAGRPIDVTVNCVVTRQNVDHLRELVDLVMPYERIRLKFSMVEPKGGGELLFRALTPDVFDAAARVRDAIEYGESKYDSEGRLVHGAFPLCHLKGLEDRYDDLKTHGFRSMVEVGESDFFPVDDRNKAHLPQCEGCVHQGGCPGLYRGYIELRAGGERLVPSLERPRSNSFNYRFQRFAEWGEVDCPLRDGALGISPWDRGRDLLVEHRGRVALFRADTRDFSDAEI
ncbi:MAG: radical SAM protein, partial [Myxococcota bacterium]